MASEVVSFEVSQDLLAALKVGVQDLGRDICLLAAVDYFQRKKLSLGKAAQLAGLSRLAFMDILAQRGIVAFDYDESAVTTELAGVAMLSDLK